ncbi:MAG TPA: low molecular weight phosphotyrosine protein phosphatase, partial [Saprospiraceae bacterium]|nr:low molecular weight phosphotyrosine protein phosphatase [Saprospiraceae bacterium]
MNVLLVCLGNICRSPLAEGILRHKAKLMDLDLFVDSAGTSDWHIGEPPDSRGINVAFENGIDISNLKARQFDLRDFDKFDLILAMDKSNYSHLLNLAENSENSKKIKLFMNFAYPETN